MKFSISQLLLTAFILIGFNNFMFSQQKNLTFKDCLWIKGIENNSTIDSIKLKSEDLLKKQLNFNPIVDFSKDKILKKYKNIVTKKSTLFVVFKSNEVAENGLLTIQRGSFKATLNNKKIICDKNILLNKGNPKTGTLVSYLFNKNSVLGKRNGSLEFDDLLFNDKDLKNQLLELIYFPRLLNEKEKNIVESYLAIKFGISLNEDKSYYNTMGDKIWDSKENKEFRKHVTGIGKEDLLGLNQMQSCNTIDDGLTVAMDKIELSNAKNKAVVKDKTFFLWGDNGKNTLLEKVDNSEEKRMKRIWKLNTKSSDDLSYRTQIRIDKKCMILEKDSNISSRDFMWIAIDSTQSADFSYINAKYIKAKINNENEVVFDKINFSTNTSCLFTIIKAPEDIINQLHSPSKLENQNQSSSGYTLFPNPVLTNENFNIQFNLKEESKVSIQITDVNGKIVKQKKLGVIDSYLYCDSLSVTGTYMILITINDVIQTNKLIVK
jgi:hypothetical protein